MEHFPDQSISKAVAMSPTDVMECIVVTPEAMVRDGTAVFVALPLFDGEIGIAPFHAPMIGRLGYGEMRIRAGNGAVESFYVDGGFVQIVNNIVYVLTNRAIPAAKVNAAAAAEQLAAARARSIATPELLAIRDRLESQARGQLRVAEKAGGAIRHDSSAGSAGTAHRGH
jgi:F-type H+-transporting ATPase subunit epsilon